MKWFARVATRLLFVEALHATSLLFGGVFSAGAAELSLGDLDLAPMSSGWGQPRAHATIPGQPLSLRGQRFAHGIGTHAPSHLRIRLDGHATRLRATCGVDDYSTHTAASVQFRVIGDGRLLWQSPVLRGTSAAERVDLPLAGVSNLLLSVTDAGDGMTSDHADWADAVIEYAGAKPEAAPLFADPAEAPGGPPNAPAVVAHDRRTGQFRLSYAGRDILDGRLADDARFTMSVSTGRVVEQRIRIEGGGLSGLVHAGAGALAAETRGPAQERFPLVRTTDGTSDNGRNNAVYDRGADWMLEGPPGATRVRPVAGGYAWRVDGPAAEIVFRPRYYQRHKNLPHFQPWTYQVRRDSITGWSSWWAYMRNFSERDLAGLLAVWTDRQFAEYGYRFIQIDECFHQELGSGQARPIYPGARPGSYVACGPATWLDWRKDLYPAGLSGYTKACRDAGFEPGIWIGTFYTDRDLITGHPDWFVRGRDGRPFVAPWASCGVDASNPEALEELVAKTYRGLRAAGMPYVKIDQLRHYLYDNLHRNLDFCLERGRRPDDLFRAYLGTARRELGPDTFLLSCWGVLPEAIGIADACRIGGDGYGPATMQQYNSWNGIVWRNDPDHCDVYPRFRPAEAGNVKKTAAVAAAPNDTLIRPALASIAGCMLILSDKPEVYRDEANLRGLRAASPVLFSVPGQLYDFDPRKTDHLRTTERTAITDGGPPAPVDADQFGAVCPWWMNEIERPFERWHVLHRLNWSDRPAPATRVSFGDLGLDPAAEYLVYEYWTGRFVGACRDGFDAAAQDPMGLSSYALRARRPQPQLVSTSRHLSQGGVDLVDVRWDATARTLSGRSRVVAGAAYELVLFGGEAESATCCGQAVGIRRTGEVVRVSWTPARSGTQEWSVQFRR